EPTRFPSTPAATMPASVRWWWAVLAPGSATAKPAKSIVASEGIGMHALSASMSTKIAGSPPSRTKCEATFQSDSEIEASTTIGAATIAAPVAARPRHRRRRAGRTPRGVHAWRPGAGASVRADARLDRPHEQPARAGHATGDRAAAGCRARGGGDLARLRPDAGAVRALRHRLHGDRPASRRGPGSQGGGAGVALACARALGAPG